MYNINQIKKITEPIAKTYDIDKVWLFGSYARGEQTEESDIDFRIDRGNVCSGIRLGAFYADLEDALNAEIDVVTTQSVSDEFLGKIGRDEVLIYAK